MGPGLHTHVWVWPGEEQHAAEGMARRGHRRGVLGRISRPGCPGYLCGWSCCRRPGGRLRSPRPAGAAALKQLVHQLDDALQALVHIQPHLLPSRARARGQCLGWGRTQARRPGLGSHLGPMLPKAPNRNSEKIHSSKGKPMSCFVESLPVTIPEARAGRRGPVSSPPPSTADLTAITGD